MQWTRHTLHNGLVHDSTENISYVGYNSKEDKRERNGPVYTTSAFLIKEHNNGA